MKIAFISSHETDPARVALMSKYGHYTISDADVIVPLGGDGFMLEALHSYRHLGKPIYGMNRGTVGFLMNQYAEEDLDTRIQNAEIATIQPLRMRAELENGEVIEELAINEVSLLRSGSQAARLKVIINDKTRIEQLVCDGAMVSTPAGSTAYNYSAPRRAQMFGLIWSKSRGKDSYL